MGRHMASHPQAKFDPLPPDLDINYLVEKTANFDYVTRITAQQIRELGLAEFEKLVLLHVIIGGKPLVVEGWNAELPPWVFSPGWLQDNVGRKEESVRDIGNAVNMQMTIGHYLSSMEKLTRQWTPTNFRDPKRQRLYLKDIDCPEAWSKHLEKVIPRTLFYLNDCVGDKGGPGASSERNEYNQVKQGKGIAAAGDLMSNLPKEMRAENMMCYIGHEGTFTPAHREMCASLGQNIMVETSETIKGEKPGSSIWFMAESKDREVVSEYFLSMLGHDIEVENHFAQINAWKKAPFPVYIVEQKVGDFLLIPPLAPHQVWNRGTRTMKVAWNRTTVETLEFALREALPRARMVCRDEQYKNKAIVYYSLINYYDRLRVVDQLEESSYSGESIRGTMRIRQLQKDFKRLFALYTTILVSEMFSPDLPKMKGVEYEPFDSNITCSYCRCNIFNRFLTCKACVGELEDSGEPDTYDVCMDCYAMGRSCNCISNLTWVEQWRWPVLTQNYDEWRGMVMAIDGFKDVDKPPSLDIAREQYGKKPVAQICQEQLARRPWRDIKKPIMPEPILGESDEEPEVDDEGRLKKKKGRKRKSRGSTKKDTISCHICNHPEPIWKVACCTQCGRGYCYGVLWRAFDLKPETVMENPNWICPRCLCICSCGKCRKIPEQIAYHPKGTLLGHDTKRVADPRSTESLVDFSRPNLGWLGSEGDDDPHSSHRMQKLRQKADAEKARDDELDEDGISQEHNEMSMDVMDTHGDMSIDPMLRDWTSSINNMRERQPQEVTADGSNGLPGAQFTRDHHSPMRNGNSYVEPHMQIQGDESAYSDLSGSTGRDRTLGMGYYQQANDANKILFDHPDHPEKESVTEEDLDLAYPRMAHEYAPTARSTKIGNHQNLEASDGNPDDPHAQFLLVQKRQKLSDARRNGRYYMTSNQLEGGGPLVIHLPLRNSKSFLQGLLDLDQGRSTEPRHNPRPVRKAVLEVKRAVTPDDDTAIVRSDLQNESARRVHSDYQDPSEDEAMLGDQLMQESNKAKQVPNLIPLRLSEQIRHLKASKSASSLNASTPARRIGRPRKSLVNKFELQKDIDNSEKPRASALREQRNDEEAETRSAKWPRVTFSEKKTESSIPEVVLDDELDNTPVDHSPHAFSFKPINQIPSKKIMGAKPMSREDIINKNAKLEAFKLVEEEMNEIMPSHIVTPKRFGPSTPIGAKSSHGTSKVLPRAPPGAILSMAERKALAAKAKAAAKENYGMNASTKSIAVKAALSRPTGDTPATRVDDGEDDSSSSGEDEIPARMPTMSQHKQRLST